MASKAERDTLVSLGATKKFNVYNAGNAIETPSGAGTFFVYSPQGKPFRANMTLAEVTNYLNTF